VVFYIIKKIGGMVMNLKKLTAICMVGILTFSVVGCGGNQTTQEANLAQQSDNEIRPADDFYDYVNAELLTQKEIPSTDVKWSWDTEVGDAVETEMDAYIDELVNSGESYEKGTTQQKIKDLYECFIDTDNRDKVGLGPLQEIIDNIRNTSNIDEYMQAVTKADKEYAVDIIVCAGTTVDLKDSENYMFEIDTTNTLIGKEYMEGEDTQKYVDYYFDYVKKVFMEFGMEEDEAIEASENVKALCKDICESTLNIEDYYSPDNTYNIFTPESLSELYSHVDVPQMLENLGISGSSQYNVVDVEQAKKVNSLLVEENLPVLKDYATFVLIDSYVEYLSTAYEKLEHELSNNLYGTESKTDDKYWKEEVESLLEWDFGQWYVEDNFSAEDKVAVENMVQDFIGVYYDIIDNQDWMSDATKEKAKLKLDTINMKIGYPDKWPETMDLWDIVSVDAGGSLISNVLTYVSNLSDYDLSRIDKKVDKSEWDVTPQTVNAFYDPSNNEILITASIIQAPFYDSSYTYEQNLGGTGWTIAHELSHAFDSSGSLYDENGNYNDWWTEEDKEKYNEYCQSIIEYYNNYQINGKNVNGELTLGENIADLAAMQCLAVVMGDDDGLKQVFEWATYTFAIKTTDDYQTYLLNTDTHSPCKVRMNASLSSCDAFYRVFDVKEGDGMYVAPEERVGIWK
jgi:putative endopeptidase